MKRPSTPDLFSAASQPRVSAPPPIAPPALDAAPLEIDHACEICGAFGSFGYGVRLLKGQTGRWFCGPHRPEKTGVPL